MKKILVLLLLITTSTTIYSQKLRDSVYVKGEYFQILYSEVLEQPLSVEYTVLCPNGKASRSGMNFYVPKGLHTSDNDDYAVNVWDKGHMAPAASFNCNATMLKSTFTYANSALQHMGLNRGAWKYLEMHERDLAEKYTVKIHVLIDFKTIQRVPGGAAIPTGFYKELSYNNIKTCYYFPNSQPITQDYTKYQCNCKK